MNVEHILVDELDIIEREKVPDNLATISVLKKFIEKKNFNNLKHFLSYLLEKDSIYVKNFINKYTEYSLRNNKK